MKYASLILASCLVSINISAQDRVRIPDPMSTMTKAEKKLLQRQVHNFFEAVKPAVATASKSTVSINDRNKRIALGTAISKNGRILTKWSEIATAHHNLSVTTPDGKHHAAVVIGVYQEHDLAVVKCSAELKPVKWAASVTPDLGEFIVLANPHSEAEGLGVVSVAPRSLREADKAFLGVKMDTTAISKKGIPLTEVVPESAAAKAGLKKGDIVTSINHQRVQGSREMITLLQRLIPGSKVEIRYLRNKKDLKTTVVLGSRDETDDPRRVPHARMSRMESMGTTPSKVRSDFPSVIQSDMAIEPNDAGGPVVDLDGKVIGISIARGSRIKTFIIPSHTIVKILADEPKPYSRDLAMRLQKSDEPGNRRAQPKVRRYNAEYRALLHLLSEIESNNEANQKLIDELRNHLKEKAEGR